MSDGFTHIPSAEERERELAYLATELAAQQLRDGTAKAQVITHYLKLASPRENIERRMMEAKIQLLEGQLEACRSDMRLQQLIIDATNALKSYRGDAPIEDVY